MSQDQHIQEQHILLDDLILLAMQFLPEKEQGEAQAHLESCTQCREEYARVQGDLAAYAMTVEMHTPPAYARERLLRTIKQESKFGAGQSADDFASHFPIAQPVRIFGMQPWVGWALAASLAVISIGQLIERVHAGSSHQAQIAQMEANTARAKEVLETMTDARAMQVGLHMSSDGTPQRAPEAHAAYMPDKGSLVFFASNLAPLQPYKTYELWLLPATGREPIAAGVFKPDAHGNANVLMPNLPKGVSAAGFGVTIEDEGGAKQPTPPILMQGS